MKTLLTILQKSSLLFCILILFPIVMQAQLKVQDSGKIQVGKVHSIDNGWLKIGNDGATNGLSFYDSSTGGTDARIFRSGNILYLSRGGNSTIGLRINSSGWLGLGTCSLLSSTHVNSPLSVYRDGGSCISSYANHDFDSGDAIRSVVYRARTTGYSVWYNGTKTFFVHGNGEVYSNFHLITSDISTKRNIETIQSPLEKVMQLRGVTFESVYDNKETVKVADRKMSTIDGMEDEEYSLTSSIASQINKEMSRKHIGVVAQEVEAVVPEVVRTTHDGRKAVSYAELVGLLIEAIKEQQTQISELQSQIGRNLLVDQTLSSSATNTSTGLSKSIVSECKLHQNFPNPFTEQTQIGYFLPSDVEQAFICIFDMQGKMLDKLDISAGENSVIIEGSRLTAGMYLYSMIAVGVEIDTKRMILTR